MSFDHHYGQYSARQDNSRHRESQLAYETPRPNMTSQFSSQSTSGYAHEPYSDHFTSSATQGTPQWQSATYNNRAADPYATSQSSVRPYQAPHKTSTIGSEFLTPGATSLGYNSSAATVQNHNPPAQSSLSPGYYQSSHSQYQQAPQQQQQQQQQQQSNSRLAGENSGYKQSQYGQSQGRSAGVTSAASGLSDGGMSKSGQIPTSYQGVRQHEQPRAGFSKTLQQPQYAQSALHHTSTALQQNQEDHSVSNTQQEAVPANTSAARVSAPQDTAQSLATVDPSQVYDPYHEYQRQLARRADAKRLQQMETERGRDQLLGEKHNEDRSAHTELDREVQGTIKPTRRNTNTSHHKKAAAKQSADKKGVKASNTADDMSAAMTLLQASNANNPNATQSEKDDLQAQMLEMFKKMREFNQKDPEMLSRLWQQERDQHLAKATQAKPSMAPEVSEATSSPATGEKRKRGPKPGWKAAKNTTEAAAPIRGASVSAPRQAQNTTSAPVSRFNPVIRRRTPPGVLWPAEKKGTLAQASIDFIMATPANRTATITAADISAILDTNPNYVDLCNAIEQNGVKINRNIFAKHLLNACPGSKTIGTPLPRSSSQAPSSQTSAPVASVAGAELKVHSNVHAPPTPKSKGGRPRKIATATSIPVDSETPSKQDAYREDATSSSRIPIDPNLDGLDAVKAFVDDKDRPAYFPPAVKQKVAKKVMRQRNAASASTTPAPPSKEEAARKTAFGELVDLSLMSESEQEPDVFYPSADRHDQGLLHRAEAEAEAEIQRPSLKPDGESTTKLQDSASALLKAPWTAFEPRPTAVPDVAALWKRAQAAASQTTPNQVEAQSSAAPTQARSSANVSGSAVVIPPGHPIRQAILALPLDKNKALRRSTYDARTIARDVLLASGRHPDMRHLNAHLDHLKEAFPSLSDNNADLCTINWDVIDPGGPPPGSGTHQLPDFPIDLGDEADGEAEEDELNDKSDNRKRTGPVDLRHQEHMRRIGGSASVTGLPMRRGPGRSPKGVGMDGGKPKARPTNTTAPPNTASPSGTSGYAALRALDEHGNPVKKRGRPVGWRKWMQKGGPETPGKAPNVANARQPEPEPVYQVYKCEWQNCRAELHNLETLRRHIHKVHGKRADTSGHWPCHWSKCGLAEQVVDASSHRTTSRFRNYSYADRDDWKAHIEVVHLRPIAWKLGDGPAGGVSDRDSELSEAYMSDRQGRRITPQIAIPEEVAAAAGSAMLRRFKRTAEEEAKQEQANAERKKRDTGPGVDKGGARLANEKRRHGFMDDLSHAQIIDDDDE